MLKSNAETAAERKVVTIAIDLIDKNTLRIMPCAFFVICNRCLQTADSL